MDKKISKNIDKEIEEMEKAPNLLSKKQSRFVCMIPSFKPDDYWENMDQGFDLAQHDFAHYNIMLDKMYFNQYDVNSFLEVSEKVLKSKPDAVIISPIFKEETIDFINKLSSQKIPFSFVDSMIPDTDFTTYYGQNSYQSGYISAKLLVSLMPENAQIMVIRTKRKGSEANQTITRYDGFMQYIVDNKLDEYVEYIDVEFMENDEDYNFRLLDKTFAENTNIKAAITFNSKVFRLAIHLASFNRKGIRIIGYDLLPLNLRYLKKGVIYCLIAQRPDRQAYLTVRDMSRELVLKRKAKKINYMPIDILFKENIEDYNTFNS